MLKIQTHRLGYSSVFMAVPRLPYQVSVVVMKTRPKINPFPGTPSLKAIRRPIMDLADIV
jgi:hypothetical protein